MGIPGFGHGSLLAPLTRGIVCRDQSQEFHQCSWALETGEVATCCHHGDGHRALHATQSLRETLDTGIIPRNTWNGEALAKSLQEVRKIEASGATILSSHDDRQWDSLRKGADAYD